MTGPIYYIIMVALLVALIVVLVLLIRKRKRDNEAVRAYQERMDKLRAERKAEEEKKKTHYSTYNETEQRATKWRHGRQYIDDNRSIPKYAAGDDMDRLRREQSHEVTSYTPFILSIVALICAMAIFTSTNSGKNTPIIVQPEAVENLSVELISADTNQERTKVYVTIHYKNESINTCYNIVTTVSLTYNDVIADTVEHTPAAMPGGTETEEIVTLTIPDEYRNEAYYVKANTKYKWKVT